MPLNCCHDWMNKEKEEEEEEGEGRSTGMAATVVRC